LGGYVLLLDAEYKMGKEKKGKGEMGKDGSTQDIYVTPCYSILDRTGQDRSSGVIANRLAGGRAGRGAVLSFLYQLSLGTVQYNTIPLIHLSTHSPIHPSIYPPFLYGYLYKPIYTNPSHSYQYIPCHATNNLFTRDSNCTFSSQFCTSHLISYTSHLALRILHLASS
jgi:hypothetical protein